MMKQSPWFLFATENAAFFRQNDEAIKTLTLNLNVFKLGWAGDGKPRLYFIP